jgi:demethylmenaquinone methyltransferase/2-methoxy-6-polyprenyl-1,4-benzoquinol methylase
MFGRIAGRYDLLNRLMTFGQDGAWRRETISMIRDHKPTRILDLGAGTGDLAAEAHRQNPEALVVACDFVPEMISVGIQRHAERSISWVIADADRLPFALGAFDAVVSGFLLRNLGDLPRSLSEQARVVRSGGKFAALDTTPTGGGWMRPIIRRQCLRILAGFHPILLRREVSGQGD